MYHLFLGNPTVRPLDAERPVQSRVRTTRMARTAGARLAAVPAARIRRSRP